MKINYTQPLPVEFRDAAFSSPFIDFINDLKDYYEKELPNLEQLDIELTVEINQQVPTKPVKLPDTYNAEGTKGKVKIPFNRYTDKKGKLSTISFTDAFRMLRYVLKDRIVKEYKEKFK